MKGIVLKTTACYFGSETIDFFSNKHDQSSFQIVDLPWENVIKRKGIDIPDCDFIFVFGLKTLVRKVRKNKVKKPAALLEDFFVRHIPKSMPVGVIDDLSYSQEGSFGDFFRNLFLNRLNGKVFLLREYMSNKKYDKRVLPFSMCSEDHTHLMKPTCDRKFDLFFRGDDSSKDRRSIVKDVNKMPFNSNLMVYGGGNRSKQKTPFKEYLRDIADARVNLHFSGNGYCCFRYQEIASVGSLIATPVYPLVVRNDYQDMVNCIKYTNVSDLRSKLDRVLSSSDLLEEMIQKSISHFKTHHTTAARYKMFLEAISQCK